MQPGQARPGQARPGQARPGQARPGQARPGQARQGKARQGKARQGKARQGKAKQSKAKPGQKYFFVCLKTTHLKTGFFLQAHPLLALLIIKDVSPYVEELVGQHCVLAAIIGSSRDILRQDPTLWIWPQPLQELA